jgi:hypothetical protein
MRKHFIDPKSSEILSVFQVFPCTTQIAFFWPKLLPALFLKKPRYPCPFEILAKALILLCSSPSVFHECTLNLHNWSFLTTEKKCYNSTDSCKNFLIIGTNVIGSHQRIFNLTNWRHTGNLWGTQIIICQIVSAIAGDILIKRQE